MLGLPRLALLEPVSDGRWIVATADGPLTGTLFVIGECRRSDAVGAEPTPARIAMDLFKSLLDPVQREQWRQHGCCWVPTPRGPVRLGRLHDLRHRPLPATPTERSLCVVPTGRPMPRGDIWTNLLLVLAADPDQFFRVANVRGFPPVSSPPPADSQW